MISASSAGGLVTEMWISSWPRESGWGMQGISFQCYSLRWWKRCTLVSATGAWHRALETLVISWVIGASFVPRRRLSVGSWVTPGWGLITRKTKSWRRLEIFSPAPPFSWEGWRAECGVDDWSCLPEEGSIKVPQIQDLESFQRPCPGRVMHLSSMGTEAPDLWDPLRHHLCISPSGCS